MTLPKRLQDHFEGHARTISQCQASLIPSILAAIEYLQRCLAHGGKVLIAGNGGSAADAQHFAAELINRFEVDRPPLAAIALTTDTSALTAIGNDDHFDAIFEKQILGLARAGDVVVLISTSGQSANMLAAARAAHAQQATIIALTGKDGGPLARQLTDRDLELRVPAQRTAYIQECHIMLLHMLCDGIDQQHQPRKPS